MAGFNLAANIVLVPAFGIVGAATATLFSYLIGAVVAARYFHRYARLSVRFSSFAKLLASGLVSLGVVFGLKGILVMNPIPEAILTMGIGMAVYVVLVFVTRAVTSEDVRFVRSLGVPIPAAVQKVAEKLSS